MDLGNITSELIKMEAESIAKTLDVAIIGSGPSGSIALRHASQVFENVRAFEAQDQPGGVWNYTPLTESNHPDLQNDTFYRNCGYLPYSMYHSLVCNIPKQVMQWRDFARDPNAPSFLTQEDFRQY